MPSLLSNDRQKLLDVIDKLRKNGVDTDVHLPTIVVVGNTSSGKSSVLSLLAGVRLPSHAQITTRSPMQINMRADQHIDFEATVKVSNYHEKESDDNDDNDVDKHPVDRLQKPKVYDNVEDVEELLAKTQKDLFEAGEQVSKDATVIDIRGKGQPDLTIVDLPGIVHAVGKDESNTIIDDINNMIDHYISMSRTVILVIQAADDDYHNSKAMSMAKLVDPKGERTLCVVTKPDKVQSGDEDSALKLIRNEANPLNLGYAVIRGRPTSELSCSIEKSLEKEKSFFDQRPWNKLNKDDVGIPALRKRLARLLFQRVQSELPRVRDDLQTALDECNCELEKLGLDLSDASARRKTFNHVVDQVVNLLNAAVDGRYYDAFFDVLANRAIAHQRDACEKFAAVILKNSHSPCMANLKDDDDVVWNAKLDKNVANGDFVEIKNGQVMMTLRQAKARNLSPHACVPASRRDLLRRIRQERGRELPGFSPWSVFKSLALKRIESSFIEPSKKYIADAYALINTVAGNALENALQKENIDKPSFRDMLTESLQKVMGEVRANVEHNLEELIKGERAIHTSNDYYSQTCDKLRMVPVKQRIEAAANDGQISVDAVLSIIQSTLSMSNIDKEAEELECKLTSYLRVAAKRFGDTVPNLVVSGWYEERIGDRVGSAWRDSITDEKLERVLNDSDARAKRMRRDQWTGKKNRIEEALKDLKNVM